MAIADETGKDTAPAVLAKTAGLSTQPYKYRFNPDGSGGPGPKYLRTGELLGKTSEKWIDRAIIGLAERIVGIGAVNRICLKAGTPWPSSEVMINHLFREMGIKWRVTNPEAFEKLEGKPAVFVANHPYGMSDAFAMNMMLEQYPAQFPAVCQYVSDQRRFHHPQIAVRRSVHEREKPGDEPPFHDGCPETSQGWRRSGAVSPAGFARI